VRISDLCQCRTGAYIDEEVTLRIYHIQTERLEHSGVRRGKKDEFEPVVCRLFLVSVNLEHEHIERGSCAKKTIHI